WAKRLGCGRRLLGRLCRRASAVGSWAAGGRDWYLIFRGPGPKAGRAPAGIKVAIEAGPRVTPRGSARRSGPTGGRCYLERANPVGESNPCLRDDSDQPFPPGARDRGPSYLLCIGKVLPWSSNWRVGPPAATTAALSITPPPVAGAAGCAWVACGATFCRDLRPDLLQLLRIFKVVGLHPEVRAGVQEGRARSLARPLWRWTHATVPEARRSWVA